MTGTSERLAQLGYVAPILSVGFIFLGTVVDPAFNWRSRSLSSIGKATGQSLLALGSLDQLAFTLFNGGLLLAPLLGIPFAYLLWTDAAGRTERAAIVLMVVTLLSNGGVGVAYLDGPFASLHFLTAMGAFFGTQITLWVHGSGLVLRGASRSGLQAIWLSNVAAIVWVVWMLLEAFLFTGDGDTWTYFAVPEFVAALAFGSWVVLQARRVLAEQP